MASEIYYEFSEPFFPFIHICDEFVSVFGYELGGDRGWWHFFDLQNINAKFNFFGRERKVEQMIWKGKTKITAKEQGEKKRHKKIDIYDERMLWHFLVFFGWRGMNGELWMSKQSNNKYYCSDQEWGTNVMF